MNPHPSDYLSAFLGAGGLLAFHGFLVAFEFSLLKIRFSHFNATAIAKLRQKRGMAYHLDNADRAIRAVRFGVAVATIGYGLVCYSLLGLFGESWPGVPGWLSAAIAFFIAVFAHYVVSEIVPRGLGLNFPEQAFRSTTLLVRIVSLLGGWIIRLGDAVAERFLHAFGVNFERGLDALDIEAQIELLGEEASEFSELSQGLLRRTLAWREIEVGAILVPRNQVQWIDLQDEVETNIKLLRESGHTRFPVCDGDLDACLGIVHIKSLFREGRTLSNHDFIRLKRRSVRLSQSTTLEDALARMLALRVHMGLVVEEEFGGVIGIVTLEQILEQLVGEIQDEFDVEEENIVPIDESWYAISGLTPLRELGDHFSVDLEREDASTVGGLVTGFAGRIPTIGETFALPPFEIAIEEADERRILAVRVRLLPAAVAGADSGGPEAPSPEDGEDSAGDSSDEKSAG